MPLPVVTVADAILTKAAQRGERISKMKLQKLLYYAQGEHLATTGEPLFTEPISAWEMGPVVREIWLRHKEDGYPLQPPAAAPSVGAFCDRSLSSTLDRYIQFSAEQLSAMTHDETPWKLARAAGMAEGDQSPTIPQESLVAYFAAVKTARRAERPAEVSSDQTKSSSTAFIRQHDQLFRNLA